MVVGRLYLEKYEKGPMPTIVTWERNTLPYLALKSALFPGHVKPLS